MSPELALAAIVALLWGPTAVWILFRAVRGKPQRSDFASGSTTGDTEPWSRPGTVALAELVDGDAFWACASCHSLNRPGASRCYSCAERRRDAGEPGGTEEPRLPGPQAPRGEPWVPSASPAQMAARPTEAPQEPRAPLAPQLPLAPQKPFAPQLQPAPEAPRLVPVMAVGPAFADSAPVAVGPGIDGAVTTHAVCPFVRLAADREAWDAVPSRANRCHAGVAPVGSSPSGSPRRPVEIAPETQQALCLSAWYTACGRHAAAGTGRLPDTPEPEVAMMAALLRAVAEGEASVAAVAPGGGAPVARPARRRPGARARRTGTNAGTEATVASPFPSPDVPADALVPAPRRRSG